MPGPRVPPEPGLRCDAKGGDSFQCAAYRVSCRVRADGSEGLPYGVVPGGSRPIHPRIGGSPAPAAARGRTGLGGGRAARRGSPEGVVRPDRNLANSCDSCEGWCLICPIHFCDLTAVSYGRDKAVPQREGLIGTRQTVIDSPGQCPIVSSAAGHVPGVATGCRCGALDSESDEQPL
ncbi:hypothetical protein Scel_38380 [Streptomyces cellostaticus]|nr:hypothetical protein Scel_38380 [Streptomyces cellostaticus]